MGATIPAPPQPAPVREAPSPAPVQRPGGLFVETPAPPGEIAGLRAEAARIRKEAGIPEGGIRRVPGGPERATVLGLGKRAAPEKQARELEDRAKQLEDINSLCLLNEAIIKPAAPEVVSVVLDIDVFRTTDLPDDEEELWKFLEELRQRKNTIFEACITDKARELFQ